MTGQAHLCAPASFVFHKSIALVHVVQEGLMVLRRGHALRAERSEAIIRT